MIMRKREDLVAWMEGGGLCQLSHGLPNGHTPPIPTIQKPISELLLRLSSLSQSYLELYPVYPSHLRAIWSRHPVHQFYFQFEEATQNPSNGIVKLKYL